MTYPSNVPVLPEMRVETSIESRMGDDIHTFPCDAASNYVVFFPSCIFASLVARSKTKRYVSLADTEYCIAGKLGMPVSTNTTPTQP